MECNSGEGAGGAHKRPPENGKFSKTGHSLVHFEQIVKGGGGHWISPLCTTVLEFTNSNSNM